MMVSLLGYKWKNHQYWILDIREMAKFKLDKKFHLDAVQNHFLLTHSLLLFAL